MGMPNRILSMFGGLWNTFICTAPFFEFRAEYSELFSKKQEKIQKKIKKQPFSRLLRHKVYTNFENKNDAIYIQIFVRFIASKIEFHIFEIAFLFRDNKREWYKNTPISSEFT